jgi:23S rRNA pseudouridine2604 synthase
LEISLNKYISETGYCSRREADRLIESGRVLLNNEVAVTGNRYRPGDEVVVDGSIVKPAAKEKMVVLAFNKPPGITTTTDTDIRGNIISYINYPKRIFPIGRLDKDSEGLIFLTNDGDIVNKVLRAGNQHEKEYSVRVDRNIDGLFMKSMSEGVRIDGTKTLPCRVRQTGKHGFSIILVQGLNRQIRKMCEVLGYKVTFLQRVRIMHVKLDKLPLGKWRYLSEPEMEALHHSVEYSASIAVPRVNARSKKPDSGRNRADKTELGLPEEQGKQNRGKSVTQVAGLKNDKSFHGGVPKRTTPLAAGSKKNNANTPRGAQAGNSEKGKKKSGSYRDFKKKGGKR